MDYPIIYAEEAEGHLRALTARQRALVLDAVDQHLAAEPMRQTRNRKKMRPNTLAPWELRIGDLRAYYEVRDEPETAVLVLAVGVKRGNQVFIAGKAARL